MSLPERMKPRRGLRLLAALFLLGCGGGPGQSGSRDATRPHIVLISIDTLRADHLGSGGYDRDTSPFMDELARKGTRFAAAWAPSPWTLPSHATLLTGKYPQHHGAMRDELSIAPDALMVQEALDVGAYTTAAVVTSLYVSGRYGFDRGFDHFHDFGILEGAEHPPGGPDAEAVFDHALEWVEGVNDDAPVFLFLHLYDVHYPYAPPAPYNEKYDRVSTEEEKQRRGAYPHFVKNPLSYTELEHQKAQYDEEIAYVDDRLREFHKAWVSRRPNTVFMIVSDHGEEFGERRSWGHGHTLYPEQLHVPWIVSGPGVRAQEITDRVGLEDVAVTVAALAGIDFDVTDGVDRAAQIRTGAAPDPGPVPARFASTYRHHTIRHRWHEPPLDLVEDLVRGRYELFDLEQDPDARQSLGRRSSQIDSLRMRMHEWLGFPWEAPRGGVVRARGMIVVDGTIHNSQAELGPGARFAVYPPDAELVLTLGDDLGTGPFAAIGGDLPAATDSLLVFHGTHVESESTALTEEQKEQLRALGYVN